MSAVALGGVFGRGRREPAPNVRQEGAPAFELISAVCSGHSPQHDFGLAEQRASAGAGRECPVRQIQRTSRVEHNLRPRAAEVQPAVSIGNVDDRTARSRPRIEPRMPYLERGGRIRRHQDQPFVRPEPECTAMVRVERVQCLDRERQAKKGLERRAIGRTCPHRPSLHRWRELDARVRGLQGQHGGIVTHSGERHRHRKKPAKRSAPRRAFRSWAHARHPRCDCDRRTARPARSAASSAR